MLGPEITVGRMVNSVENLIDHKYSCVSARPVNFFAMFITAKFVPSESEAIKTLYIRRVAFNRNRLKFQKLILPFLVCQTCACVGYFILRVRFFYTSPEL